MIKPLKTDMEKSVWQEIWKLSESGKYYVDVEDLYKPTGISKSSMPGVIRSMQDKGWVFCFGDWHGFSDLEVTCMACDAMRKDEKQQKKKNGSCNHENCHCKE